MTARTHAAVPGHHVGSLLRPPEVLAAREDRASRAVADDELRQIEDDAIREVVRRQEEVGLRSITDGEFRRESWHMDFIYQLGGVTKAPDDTIHVHFENKDRQFDWAPPAAHVSSLVTLPQTIFAEHFAFLRDTSRRARRSSRSRRRAWSTTAAGGRPSTPTSTRTSTSSGRT